MMPKLQVLNQQGSKVTDLTLNDYVFGIAPHQQVLYDVVNAQRAAMRQGTHDVKNRGEKKELVVLVKGQLDHHNGDMVGSCLDQRQEAMQ